MSDATPLFVALIDDDEDLRDATTQLLGLNGFTVRPFADAGSAMLAIGADFSGVVVTDVRMPGMSGIELFHALQNRDQDLPVILVTGHGDVQMAVDVLKAGAWDFLTKPFDTDALLAAVARAITARKLVLENRRLRRLAEASATDDLVGEVPAMRRLRVMIPALADADLDLVIQGETGTGKALFARLVHRAGRRARHRFLTIDCATVPAALVERELFARNGLIARADRGTLFLHNLHAASAQLQHGLARFAETRAVASDARDPDAVNVRIIASITEGQLDRIAAALFHRLAGVPLRVPPLSERREDIPLLFAHFVARAADRHRCSPPSWTGQTQSVADRHWPGNVRELEKAAERFCLGIEQIEAAPQGNLPLPDRIDAFERAAIKEAVLASRGQISAAIHALQIPRKTFYYRARRLGIDLRALRERFSAK